MTLEVLVSAVNQQIRDLAERTTSRIIRSCLAM